MVTDGPSAAVWTGAGLGTAFTCSTFATWLAGSGAGSGASTGCTIAADEAIAGATISNFTGAGAGSAI